MPARIDDWTVAMLDALPEDGQRHEIIDGVHYVTPAPRPRHQDVVARLAALLVPYVDRVGGAVVLVAPTDVRKGQRTSIQPDVLVVELDDTRRPARPIQPRNLLLAVEVLSDRPARTDRQEKRELYQREGVAEYWIVDADGGVVDRWRPGDVRPEVLSDRIEWQLADSAEPLSIDLSTFFGALIRDE